MAENGGKWAIEELDCYLMEEVSKKTGKVPYICFIAIPSCLIIAIVTFMVKYRVI